MEKLLPWILTLSIVAGQLIKIPLGTTGGLTLLDIVISIFSILGLTQIKFNLIKPATFVKAALIFIAICIMSLVFTPLHLNLSEYLIAFFYTVRFSLYILFGWLLQSGSLFQLRENIYKILIFSGVILAALGLLQFVFLPDLSFLTLAGWDPHYYRTVSTFLDPNFAGAYFVLTLLLLLPYSPRWLRLLGVTLVYVALLTTFSRSGYLMFLISCLSYSLLKKSKSLFFKTIIAFVILLVGFQIYTQLISKPRHIDREKSASFRLNTWQQGWAMFQKSPFLGVGYNAYRYGLKEYHLGDEQFIQSHGGSSNDSSLLFVLSTTGIIGFFSYLFFLFSIIKSGWKSNFIIVSGLIGLIIHSFFANSLFYPPILAWVILATVAIPKK